MSSTAPMDAQEHGEVAAIRHALAAGWLSAEAVREAAGSDEGDLLLRLASAARLPGGALDALRRVASEASDAAARRGLARDAGPGRTERVVLACLAPAPPSAADPWADVPTREHDEVVPIPRAPRRTAEHVGVLTLPGATSDPSAAGARTEPAPPPAKGAAAPPARTRYGPYEVVAELARGGMGVVYRARHAALETEVALKVLLAGGAEGVEERLRFEQEARTTAALVHPGIVAVRDYGVEGGAPWLAMDLVRGESLRALVAREGPLEPRRAAELLASVSRAVAHAHGQGVLHRDLKPHNVLVDETGAARLTDFGLARRVDVTGAGLTVTGQILGTPAYMPPEQAGGVDAVDARSDVYGLGATLYELLVGRPPFQGVTVLHVLTAVLGTEPLPPSKLRPGLDRDLETIVLCCLEKEPGRRYASAAALAEDLERFVAGLPVEARPLTWARRTLRGAWRRRRALAWAAVGLAAALSLVAGRARERARGGLREVEAAVAAMKPVVPPGDASRRAQELGGIALREHLGDRRFVPLVIEMARFEAAASELGRACRALDAVIAVTPGDLAAAHAFRARVRHQSGRSGARDDLELVLASGTCPPDALHDVVVLLAAYGRAAEAQAVASATLTAHPGDARVHRALAEATLAAGDPAGAVAPARRAVELDPSRDSLLVMSAVTFEQGDRAAALEALTRVLDLDPGDLGARRLRASYRSQLGDHRGAVEDATACIDGEHRRSEMLWLRLASSRALGDDDRVVEDLRTLLELEPAGKTAAMLAMAELERGHLEEARAASKRAQDLDPQDPVVMNALLCVWIEGDDPAAIERLVRRIEQIAPTHPIVPRARAALHLLRHEPDQAIRDAERAVASDPQQAIGHYFLGLGRAQTGDLVGGIAALESARALQPENRMVLEVLSQAHLLRGDLAAARPLLARLLVRGATTARIWNLQGMLLGQEGDLRGALAAFSEALRRDPKSVVALANRASARLELAERSGDRADWEAAVADAAEALRRDPERAASHLVLAEGRAALGDPDGALEAVEAALKGLPGDPRSLLLRAELRLRRGDRAGAEADVAAVPAQLPPVLRPRLAALRAALRAP